MLLILPCSGNKTLICSSVVLKGASTAKLKQNSRDWAPVKFLIFLELRGLCNWLAVCRCSNWKMSICLPRELCYKWVNNTGTDGWIGVFWSVYWKSSILYIPVWVIWFHFSSCSAYNCNMVSTEHCHLFPYKSYLKKQCLLLKPSNVRTGILGSCWVSPVLHCIFWNLQFKIILRLFGNISRCVLQVLNWDNLFPWLFCLTER